MPSRIWDIWQLQYRSIIIDVHHLPLIGDDTEMGKELDDEERSHYIITDRNK